MNEQILSFMRIHPVRTQRGLEILTGLTPWVIIFSLIAGSFFLPEAVAYIIIAFNVYWLYRSLTMGVYGLSGYLNVKATQKTDWMKKLQTDPKTKDQWKGIYHIFLLCNVKEKIEVMERTLDALVNQDFPRKQILVVLAMEAREGEDAKKKARILLAKYKNNFGKVVATFHPLTPGETIGKHSNEAYAAREAKRIFVDEAGLDINQVTITTADADSVLPGQYFSLLAFKFLTVADPFYSFYQAPQFSFNNLHRVPVMIRILEIISGVSQLAGLRKFSRRYLVVSTYTTSLWLLNKIGYWDIDAIPEDWHINLKAYFLTGGKVRVEPLYLPISIDAPESSSSWKTYVNKYQAVKRQAWGVTDIPYVIKQFFLHPEIPLFDKLTKISFVMESHFVWTTNWFLITLGANIPTLLNPVFARTTLGFNLSRMSGFILTICLVGLLAIIFISSMMDPKAEHKKRALLSPGTYLQWILLPVAGLLLGTLPGLESQTRLMLGKYIEYRVTEKV